MLKQVGLNRNGTSEKSLPSRHLAAQKLTIETLKQSKEYVL